MFRLVFLSQSKANAFASPNQNSPLSGRWPQFSTHFFVKSSIQTKSIAFSCAVAHKAALTALLDRSPMQNSNALYAATPEKALTFEFGLPKADAFCFTAVPKTVLTF